jgi:hypothetical protein
MAGRAPGDSVVVDPMHPLGRVARHLARVAEGDIGVAGRMHRLSPHVVVESAEAILVLVGVTVTGSGSETVMEEDGLGRRGIGARRILGENRRLREHRGVTGIGDRGIGGRRLGLLVLVLVHHHREGGGRFV